MPSVIQRWNRLPKIFTKRPLTKPVAQQVWENAKFIRREMLDQELKDRAEAGFRCDQSEEQGEQASERGTWQTLSAQKREQKSIDMDGH